MYYFVMFYQYILVLAAFTCYLCRNVYFCLFHIHIDTLASVYIYIVLMANKTKTRVMGGYHYSTPIFHLLPSYLYPTAKPMALAICPDIIQGVPRV